MAPFPAHPWGGFKFGGGGPVGEGRCVDQADHLAVRRVVALQSSVAVVAVVAVGRSFGTAVHGSNSASGSAEPSHAAASSASAARAVAAPSVVAAPSLVVASAKHTLVVVGPSLAATQPSLFVAVAAVIRPLSCRRSEAAARP